MRPVRYLQLLSTLMCIGGSAPFGAAEEPVTFRFMRDVRPVLEERCLGCHGKDKREGKLRLDRPENLFEPGREIVVPGKPTESELLVRIGLDHDDDDIMPPKGKALDAKQIEGISVWIKAGAHWPDDLVLRSPEPEKEAPAETLPPLSERIDALIATNYDGPVSPPAEDAEFVRRIYLDLAGRIPSASEVTKFLEDTSPDKRAKTVEGLLAGRDYPAHMADVFSVYLLERRTKGKDIPLADWERFLMESFEANKPWDVLMHEILAADGINPVTRPAAKFYLDRRDANLITADISRLMLGRDVGCAQCHDHPVYPDYTQAEYQGLFAYLSDSRPQRNPKTEEFYFTDGVMKGPIEYQSVFTEKAGATGPRLMHREEVPVPDYGNNLYLSTYDKESGLPRQPRFQRRRLLAMHLPAPDNKAFRRNAANRLWFFMMGRGLVEPLDQHHSENPPAYPEILDLLADELLRTNFDIKTFLGELALTETYQRSSLLPDSEVAPETFATFNLKPLSAEQMARSVLQALNVDRTDLDFQEILTRFREAYANPPGEPEESFNSSPMDPFLLGNDPETLIWLDPEKQKRGLIAGLWNDARKAGNVTDRLYLNILSRHPSEEERAEFVELFLAPEDVEVVRRRIVEAAWALLASSEFRFNH